MTTTAVVARAAAFSVGSVSSTPVSPAGGAYLVPNLRPMRMPFGRRVGSVTSSGGFASEKWRAAVAPSRGRATAFELFGPMRNAADDERADVRALRDGLSRPFSGNVFDSL